MRKPLERPRSDLIDLTGKRFGYLTVVSYAGKKYFTSQSISRWNCKCDCGKYCVAGAGHLRRGTVASCGCKRACMGGESTSPLAIKWYEMCRRFKVDIAWQEFEYFKSDVTFIPDGKTLQPVDYSKPIGPDNYRFGRMDDYPITVGDITKSISDWARSLGMSRQAIQQRIKSGKWSEEDAVTTPKGQKPLSKS